MHSSSFPEFWGRVPSDGQPPSTSNGETPGEVPKQESISSREDYLQMLDACRQSFNPHIITKHDILLLQSCGMLWGDTYAG